MKLITSIEWHEAVQISKEVQKHTRTEKLSVWEAVKTENMELYDAQDIAYYAEILGVESNKIRKWNMMFRSKNAYEYIETFKNDETDDILNFY